VKVLEKLERIKGCMIGGAIGDALGWPVEFLEISEIKNKYGVNGIVDLVITSEGNAEITDDTQMTLFTAEGLLRAETRSIRKGICHAPSVIQNAYLRWLNTQGYDQIKEKEWIYDGWLITHNDLFHKRAPGNTCIQALNSNEMGLVDHPLNESKGCGGVMRVAPVGLFLDVENAFDTGMDCAALTHGHPTGYLVAGMLAYIIALLVKGEALTQAIDMSIKKVMQYQDCQESSDALNRAVKLSKSNIEDAKAISLIGEGWIAEEALAIAVYCSLKYKNDFETALITAVNHNGDSDSTGAITGNILGAFLGIDAIPYKWKNNVELSKVILEIADDLYHGHQNTDEWWNKYPGY